MPDRERTYDVPTPVPSGLPELPVTFRPTRTRVVLLSIGAALLAVLTVLSLMLEAFTTGDRATFIGTGLLVFGVLVLLSRPKVVASDEGVTVVNLTTSRKLAWAQIVRVNLRAGDAWVHLDLSDGTSLLSHGHPARHRQGPGRRRRPRAARPRRSARHRGLRHLTGAAAPHGVLAAPDATSLITLVPRAHTCPAPAGAPANRGVTYSGNGRIVL
ncbi:hypothetical protein GCM10020000_67810 [Streptomyces olivoverticillatus]